MNQQNMNDFPEYLEPEMEMLDGETQVALRKVWEISASSTEAIPFNIEEAGKTIWKAVEPQLLVSKSPKVLYLAKSYRWYSLVAVVALLLAVSWYLWQPQPIELQTNRASTLAQVLPDGSKVSLNSGSIVTFVEKGGKRFATVEGEAIFEVKSKTQPFVVETFNATIEVLGTVFNVRARSGDMLPKTDVFLERGSLKIISKLDTANVQILKPGESISVQYQTIERDTGQKVNPMIWKEEGLNLVNIPLQDIVSELARRFDIQITLTPALKEERFTLLLNRVKTPEKVLEALVSEGALSYHKKDNQYFIQQE